MKKKIFALIVAILVLAFSLLSFSACTTIEDFKDDVVEKFNDFVVIDDAGNELEDGKTYDMPKALKFYSSSPNSSKTIRLTASVTPSSASDKSVDWTVSWVHPSSEWATGKTVTDYVTVTPTSDGALTADVLWRADFGEQIVISVRSRVNSEACASCTVDNYRSIRDLFVGSSLTSSDGNFAIFSEIPFPDFSWFSSSNAQTLHARPLTLNIASQSSLAQSAWVYGVPYTVSPTYSSYRVYITHPQQFCTVANTSFSSSVFSTAPVEVTMNRYSNDQAGYITIGDFYAAFTGGLLIGDHANSILASTYYNKFVELFRQYPDFTVHYDVTFSDIGVISREYTVSIDPASIGLVAESLDLSSSTIRF